MDKQSLKKYQFSDTPGVYFFLGARKEILYIGKATSLKNRVRSYFADDIIEKRSALIAQMVEEAKTISVTETDSVLEALILETNLIRSHKPKFNTRSKDDKSYNHLVITKEEWPRVLVVREKDLTEAFFKADIMYTFGPFPSGQLFKEALKIVKKLFKFYDMPTSLEVENKTKLGRGKIDFNRQIGLYPSPDNRSEYLQTIKHIKLFFEGRKKLIINELTREMHAAAKRQEFERANNLKKRIFALEHIKDISLMKREVNSDNLDDFRIEAYDIAHLFGDSMVGVMTVLESGAPIKSEYRKFKIQTVEKANDTAALEEILERRFRHTEWKQPQLIVVDGSIAQKNIALKVLKNLHLEIPIVAVVKDDRHKPIRLLGNNILIQQHKNNILLANAESHRFALQYHRMKRGGKFT